MRTIVYEALIFDIDGTLYQTEKVALPAFHSLFEELKRQGIFRGESPTEEKIVSCFGMTIPELWETLLPDATMEERDRANEQLAQAELDLMKRGRGQLYPGVQATLRQLHEQGVKLYTASNGEQRYVETVVETTGIAPYFTKLFSAGEYKTKKKEELVERVLDHAGTRSIVMVGDRRSDITAGKANNLLTVGCDFGFAGQNELGDADLIIEQFVDLFPALQKLAQQKVK